MSPLRIREAMKKNPHHKLWDKPLHKWTEQERQDFENLEQKKKLNWKAVNSVKVIRISDGTIYDSISDCRRKNGLCKKVMDQKILIGLEFKRA